MCRAQACESELRFLESTPPHRISWGRSSSLCWQDRLSANGGASRVNRAVRRSLINIGGRPYATHAWNAAATCGTLIAMRSTRSTFRSDSAPTLFKSAKAFETWLRKNHTSSDSLWVKIAKRGADEPSITYPEAVEIALCWGWIDGQKKGLDDQYFLQRFTPRRARSIWSKVNVNKVAALIEAGRMQPPGYAQIEAAKADGRWARAYDGARSSAIPEDLLAALDAAPKAKAFFATISAANRYAVLWRIQTAVRAETRAKRIAQLVEMLARGETIHIFKPKAKT